MMSLTNPPVFQINFNPGDGVYYAGQLVNGHVVIRTQAEIKDVKGLNIKFDGGAEVSWKVETKDGTRTVRSSEVYFSNQTYLFGGDGITSSLPPGSHTIPFSFNLPTEIPSSCENDYGHVRYTVKAMLKTKKTKFKVEAFFGVIGLLDLNYAPQTLTPFHKISNKNLGCFCFKSGPIAASIHLPKTGFIQGEEIPITAEIDNKSDCEMIRTYAKLIQTVTYKAQGRYKTWSKTIAKTSRGPIEAGGEDVWLSVPLSIPNVPPSKLANCSIMDVDYMLKFGVEPCSINLDLKIKVPITIGTIGARGMSYEQQPPFNPCAPQAIWSSGHPQMMPPNNFAQILPGGTNQHAMTAPPTFESVMLTNPSEKPF